MRTKVTENGLSVEVKWRYYPNVEAIYLGEKVKRDLTECIINFTTPQGNTVQTASAKIQRKPGEGNNRVLARKYSLKHAMEIAGMSKRMRTNIWNEVKKNHRYLT